MSDEVKFIFKTLLKVPVIIMVSFVILNIFAFFFIYFKVLGLSYVVMQTAVENNYLPKTELTTLCNYVYEFEDIPMVTNSAIIVAKDGDNYSYVQSPADATVLQTNSDSQNAEGQGRTYTRINLGDSILNTATKKVQYGKSVTVGVHCGYKLVWPLGYKETIEGVNVTGATQGEGQGVSGLESTTFSGFKSDAELDNGRADKETIMNFDICYTVPGLKYYPDLLHN